MLMTASGHAVAIEDLKLGDLVQAKDVASGAEAWKQTTALLSSNQRRLYTLSVVGGEGAVERIEVTDNHPFHVPGLGWIQTLDLAPGMAVETAGGGTATVKSIIDSGRDAKTYNLEVAGYHTYYAYAGQTALLVHNACGPKKSRNRPPSPLKDAEGRPHSIVERSGKGGQYTTHNGDGTYKQYRGASGRGHGYPRPNIKENKIDIAPGGKSYPGKPRVRAVRPGETPGG